MLELTQVKISFRPMLMLHHIGDEVESEKWRNMFFLKSGATVIIMRDWPSESEAREVAKQSMERIREIAIHFKSIIFNPRTQWEFKCDPQQVSHAIPIPWKQS